MRWRYYTRGSEQGKLSLLHHVSRCGDRMNGEDSHAFSADAGGGTWAQTAPALALKSWSRLGYEWRVLGDRSRRDGCNRVLFALWEGPKALGRGGGLRKHRRAIGNGWASAV